VQVPAPAPRARRLRLPASPRGWVHLLSGVLAALVVVGMVAFVLMPLLADPHGYGRNDWDQMESNRYLVRKTILRFHEFPFWNPYACGGHPAWAAFEGDSIVAAPWLPAYLLLPLPVALRVEIAVAALWGAMGAWLLASRFTRSYAACAFVAVVFAVNGRWTLQLTAGHTGHLVYAWMPWALFFFDRAIGAQPALGPPRMRSAVSTGVCLAMMVYTGGIDALPETAIVLGAYAVLVAITTRSTRPLAALAVAGAASVGLSAPKLLPALEVMRRYGQAVDSRESLTPQQLVELLTDRVQGFTTGHAGIADSAWHEVGMYLGWAVVMALGVGTVTARGVRVTALKAIGLVLLVFGLGSFSQYAPFALAHHLPVFSSQHVPSRWLYPAALLLACVAVAAFEQGMVRAGRARAVVEGVALLAVVWIARDVATVARFPFEDHLHDSPPKNAESVGRFHTETKLPKELEYQSGEWAPTSLSAEIANIGVIECHTFRGLDNFDGLSSAIRGYEGRPAGLGARGVGEREYHGEAYLTDGVGTATVTQWSPNAVEVRVDGATPGQQVVVNQNWDPGWSVDGARAFDTLDTVAAPVSAPTQTFHFRYRPLMWWPGWVLFGSTVAALFAARWAARRRRVNACVPASGRPRADPGAPP
jgi:hypothetical protein